VHVHPGQSGGHADGGTGTVPAESASIATPRSLDVISQTPQRRWSDGAASQRSPLSDASITAAAAELAAARAAGLQARALWQTPSPASAAAVVTSVCSPHTELPRTLLPDAQAWNESKACDSLEQTVLSPAKRAVDPISQPQASLHGTTTADPLTGHSEPRSPADEELQLDLHLQDCSHAADAGRCSWPVAALSGSASNREEEPQALCTSAEQSATGPAAEAYPASRTGNGWHPPASSSQRLPSDFGEDPAEDVPLRVRFGGSRSRTPTPHPSDDGGPLVEAHSTAASESHEDGVPAPHATLLASSAVERGRLLVDNAPIQHADAAMATAGDAPSAHADSSRIQLDASAAMPAGSVPSAFAGSVAPEQRATHADAAKALPHQLDVQQPGRPLMRWAPHAPHAASADQDPAQAQGFQHPSSLLPRVMQDPVLRCGQQDDSVDPTAAVDLATPPLCGVQLPAVVVEIHTQPASPRHMETQSRAPLPRPNIEGFVPEQTSPADAARPSDRSASEAATPRAPAATPQRGLLARLPFAGVLRARRWRRRSDGHTVDETILGARPPSHDGGAVSAGFCTPPRTPRRYDHVVA